MPVNVYICSWHKSCLDQSTVLPFEMSSIHLICFLKWHFRSTIWLFLATGLPAQSYFTHLFFLKKKKKSSFSCCYAVNKHKLWYWSGVNVASGHSSTALDPIVVLQQCVWVSMRYIQTIFLSQLESISHGEPWRYRDSTNTRQRSNIRDVTQDLWRTWVCLRW